LTRLCLYDRIEPARDRWLPGDRLVRQAVRRLVRGGPRPGGLDKVTLNLRLGLERLGVAYEMNLPFDALASDDRIGVLGRGRYALEGYRRAIPLVAGIGLMTHPSEWPDLCETYPVALYLQHSDWANAIYRPYFGARCRVWPVGIDTESWRPAPADRKQTDFLIYDKIMWRRDARVPELLEPVRRALAAAKLSARELRYGAYDEAEYRAALGACRAMIFLCEHESQGLAYQEALASGVPVLAWDQGRYLDPNCAAWGQPDVPATSVPYFDARCGLRFRDAREFPERLGSFLEGLRAGTLAPRDYALETLTLEKSARRFLALLEEARA